MEILRKLEKIDEVGKHSEKAIEKLIVQINWFKFNYKCQYYI